LIEKTEDNLKRKLLFIFFICSFLSSFYSFSLASEIKKDNKRVIQFSSETARYKKSDNSLHLAGGVIIKYEQYVIKSDVLIAKTEDVNSSDFKIIEASKNIYFSNNSDITAKGDKLFMDIEKKFVSIEGNVEFSQGKSLIRAKKINVDLETETVDFEGIKDSIIKN
jgi:lipopolysaccharide export system protein LptA